MEEFGTILDKIAQINLALKSLEHKYYYYCC